MMKFYKKEQTKHLMWVKTNNKPANNPNSTTKKGPEECPCVANTNTSSVNTRASRNIREMYTTAWGRGGGNFVNRERDHSNNNRAVSVIHFGLFLQHLQWNFLFFFFKSNIPDFCFAQ